MKNSILSALFLFVLGSSFAQNVALKDLIGRWKIVGAEIEGTVLNIENPAECFKAFSDRIVEEKGFLTAADSVMIQESIVTTAKAMESSYFIFNENKSYIGVNSMGDGGAEEEKGTFEYSEKTGKLALKPADQSAGSSIQITMISNILWLNMGDGSLLFRREM